jgi:DNA-binding LacI/PurR family transcriptional regulator
MLMTKERPTIADVATRAGVSKGAVSFALNGRPGLAKATVDRILAAADELGWRPSNRARSLSVSKAFALGLVITRDPGVLSSDPFFPAFIGGVESVLAPRGQALVLQVVAPGDDEEAGYRRLAQDGRVDGVFLSDLRHDDPRIDLLTSLGLPAVTLNRPEVPSPFPAVCLDDRPGTIAVVQHLLELGHRRIAHVAGPQDFVHATARRDAFVSALTSPRSAGSRRPGGCLHFLSGRPRSSTPTTGWRSPVSVPLSRPVCGCPTTSASPASTTASSPSSSIPV